MIVGWRIYYLDGAVWDSTKPWSDAPDDGVALIVAFMEGTDSLGRPRRSVLSGHETYFHDGNQLLGSNHDTVIENEKRYPGCYFKRGMWAPNDVWAELRSAAYADFEVPK